MPYGKIIFDFSANCAHPLSVLFLYFFPLDELFDAPRAKQHDIRRGGEGEDINDEAPGEGNDGLHRRIDGQRALKVGADEEHIEGLVADDPAVEHDLVEQRGNTDGRGKHGNGAQDGLVLRLDVARAVQVNGDGQHRAVADHGLDVDADLTDEDVARIEHDAQPRKQSVGGKIGHQAMMHLALFEDARQQADVHGRGAELPGEGVPLKVPDQSIIFNIKAVNEHLEDLEQDDEDARDEHGAPDACIVALFVCHAQENACDDG